MVKRYELTDRQWDAIREVLPGKPSDPGRTGRDNRAFVNGVLWVLRSGARWSDLPPRYGENWKTLHTRFVDFHRELTRRGRIFPLRFDPCLNAPLSGPGGGERSVGHGIFEHHPPVA
jgi:transposase